MNLIDNSPELVYGGIALVIMIFMLYLQNAAYRNGATDGYGYAREPGNPGYQKAGDYLVEAMSHRWPELKDKSASSHVFDTESVSDFFDARPVDPQVDLPLGEPERRQR